MSEGGLEHIEILGVSAYEFPPIGALHLPLEPGVHVLYGKNGAGKTRTLEVVRGALSNRWDHDSSVWVHMRVVEDELPGVLHADDYFRESLFFELSDALVRSIHYSEWGPSNISPDMRLDRLWEYVPFSGQSDVPDSIQGLVTAIAWLHGLDEFEAAAFEILQRCYLSLEMRAGGSRVYLSSMGAATPYLTSTGRIAAMMAEQQDEDDESWTESRGLRAPRRPWDLEDVDIARMLSDEVAAHLQEATEEGRKFMSKLLRAAFSLEPPREFFEKDEHDWIPSPLLIVCGAVDAAVLEIRDSEDESESDVLARETLTALDQDRGTEHFVQLSTAGSVGIRVSEELSPKLAGLGDKASRKYSSLLKDAPPLEPVLLDPSQWIKGRLIRWTAYDVEADLRPLGLDDLSEAQRKWALVAIRQSLVGSDTRAHLILDEPERALHATATRHLAQGLTELAKESGLLLLVASHAPGMLSNPDATLLHVHRGDHGEVLVSPLVADGTARLREAADSLGLTAPDLLQLTRLFLYVEGEHDKVVLNEYFSSSFESAGIQLMTLGGARRLSTVTDSRFVFDYTDADVLILLDNLDGLEFARTWEEARNEARKGDKERAAAVMKNARADSYEAEQLRDFALAAIDTGASARLHFWGLNKPDIIYYLPSESFIAGSSWDELGAQYHKERVRLDDGRLENIKLWLERRHSVKVTTRKMRAAAADADLPHPELRSVEQHALSLAQPKQIRR